jgi:hypothetical protein
MVFILGQRRGRGVFERRERERFADDAKEEK